MGIFYGFIIGVTIFFVVVLTILVIVTGLENKKRYPKAWGKKIAKKYPWKWADFIKSFLFRKIVYYPWYYRDGKYDPEKYSWPDE